MKTIDSQKLAFTKMHGLGNDFIVLNNFKSEINLSSQQIQYMSDRHFGIGFDQLLILEKSHIDNVDFKYRIFNADGLEVEQCGNGARCFARYVREKGLSSKNKITVETMKGSIILYYVNDDYIQVDMGVPTFNASEIPFNQSLLEFDQLRKQYTIQRLINNALTDIHFTAVSVGNPHMTITVEDVDTYPVELIGSTLVKDSIFPQGVNVGFMQIDGRDKIKLRVYERGVGETLACGTGACAAVANGIYQGVLNPKVKVQLAGGLLNISWKGEEATILMEGSANLVYEGIIEV